MNINVYLPDALGKEAKEAKLPLSRVFRGAVERELKPIRLERRRKRLEAHLEGRGS